ncbi:MAG: restriction endonuclease subunit S, partial [Aeromonas sp.]
MGNNWTRTTIGEYCPFIYGKSLPARERNEAGSIPVFGSGGLSGFHDKPLVSRAGIIIGRKGTVGSIVYSEQAFWPIDTTFYFTKESINELKFTYYLLQTLGLHNLNSDSAVPGLNRDEAHSISFNLPPEKERAAIAKYLSSLDNKITLNRQINQTLERMAQALFKSWFVDFDPVIDNALDAGFFDQATMAQD